MMFRKSILGVVVMVVGVFLIGGCGGGTAESGKMPHLSAKQTRAVELKDWSWNVDASLSSSGKILYIDFYGGLPVEVQHTQIFLNTDNNKNTGFTGADGWEIEGADYLIEDDDLYRSLSNTEWEWEYVGTLKERKFVQKRDGEDEWRVLVLNAGSFSISDLLRQKTAPVMIEVYNFYWEGNYPTVTGLQISLDDNANVGKPKVRREELLEMIRNDEDYSQVDVSDVIDMSYLFKNKEVKYDITGWDVSNVKNMEGMFYKATFNQPIGNWDVSSVTNMKKMFYMTNFNQPIGDWDVSSVTDMSDMFHSDLRFNQPIGDWDVSSVTDMSGMFYSASDFNQPIGNWDVSSVTDMNDMFRGAHKFNQPIGNWDVSQVKKMKGMFCYAKVFNQPIDNWDVSNVNTMEEMFYYADKFNQPIGNWDVSNVTNMRAMFYHARSFNQPLEWDVSNVWNMEGMFYFARKFDQPIQNWNVSNVRRHKDFAKYSALSPEHMPHFPDN